MSHKPKRMAYLMYPQESHLNIKWVFFTTHQFLLQQQAQGSPVVFNNYQDLAKYRIGATQDYAYSEEFWQLANTGALNVEVMQKNKLNIMKLLAGRIDLFPSYQFKMLWNAKQGGYDHLIGYLPKAIRDKKYFNPFSKASSYPNVLNGKIARRYDEILRSFKKKGVIKKLLKKYGVH
jgi:polar amino acid transport system substrate-binding protein